MSEELKTHKLQLPDSLLESIRDRAKSEDENISSLIRRVMADYVGWQGQTRQVTRKNIGK